MGSFASRALVVVGVAALLLPAAACGDAGDGSDAGVSVVATTTILGDVAGRVIDCGGGEASTLMPVGSDPHDYAPASSDVREMVTADLVVANGLGLEEGLTSAIDAAVEDGATLLELAPLLDPLPLVAEDHDDHAEAGSLDPHVWLDIARMARAAELIGGELGKTTGEAAYATCGRSVADELRTVDGRVREILAQVPADERLLVTDHRAFGYFASAYDFEVLAVVIPGGSTMAEPSSAHLAELVEVLKEMGVPAIFGNVAEDPALLETLAEETGRPIAVVPLYVGSVGPDGSGAEDYPSMMLENARLITEALTGRTWG